MASAAVTYDLGTGNTRGKYIGDINGNPGSMIDISFLNGPSTIELEYPAEVAVTVTCEGKVTFKYGWQSRSVAASERTKKLYHLKSLYDDSEEMEPARRAIMATLEELKNLGYELSPSALLLGYYQSLHAEQEKWCERQECEAPTVCWFTVPAVNKGDVNKDTGKKDTGKIRRGEMIALLKKAGFNAQIKGTECEARMLSIAYHKDMVEKTVVVVDLGAGTGQITTYGIDQVDGDKRGFLKELQDARCIGQGGDKINKALEEWMLSKFPSLSSWQISTAKLLFHQQLKHFRVDDPDWRVELLHEPELVLTGAVMDKEICPRAYGKIIEFIEGSMETFKTMDRTYFVGGLSSSNWLKTRIDGWDKHIRDKIRFNTATSCTQVAEGCMLAGMNWITVSLRIANRCHGIGMRVSWNDILGGNREKPTKQERRRWGGNASGPDLIIQQIKNKGDEIATSPKAAKVLWMEREVDKEHPFLEIPFAMGKTDDIEGFWSDCIAYKFSPQKYYQWLWCPEIDLSKSEELPEESKTIHYCFRLFSDGFNTRFQLEANETWTKNEHGLEPFVDGCLEEMLNEDLLDGTAEESTGNDLDALLKVEFDSDGLRAGGILAEPEAGSNQPKVTSNTGTLNASPRPQDPTQVADSRSGDVNSDDAVSRNGMSEQPSSHSPSPLSPPPRKRKRGFIGPKQQQPKRHKGASGRDPKQTPAPATTSEPKESEDAEQSKFLSYPVGDVLSSDTCAEMFKILRSDDVEVNAPIVDAKLSDLEINHQNSGVCILDTSVWRALTSNGQKLDLARMSLPDKFFDFEYAVIPIPTPIVDGVYWSVAILDGPGRLLQEGLIKADRFIHIFLPVTPDSGDGPTLEKICVRLKRFISAVALEQKSMKLRKTIAAVNLNVRAETHSRSSGLQVIEVIGNFLKLPREFLDNENARLVLQPAEIKKQTEAKFLAICENFCKLLVPENPVHPDVVAWQLGPLSTANTLFLPPKFYTALCGNGKSEDIESAKRQIKNMELFKNSKVIGIPVLEEGGRWLFFVIREPSRLKAGKNGVPKDLIIGVESKEFDFAHVYYRLLRFLINIFDIPCPKWAYGGKKCEKYGSELGLPWPEDAIKTGYQLIRKAKELARDAEGLLRGAVIHERIVDNIEPKVIMAGWMSDIEKIMGNRPYDTVAGSSINRLPREATRASERARSVPLLSAHNSATTRKRAASVVDTGSSKRNKLPNDAPKPSEADVQMQLDYMQNSFPTDEESKLFKNYHIGKIQERKSVIVSVSPGQSKGEFDTFVSKFMPPKSGTQSASVDLSRCLSCRYYDDQEMGSCDSRDSLCSQSKGKDRPTIFEYVEMLSPQDEKLVQGGVTWFVVPVHVDNKLWRHALAELKRQVEALKADEEEDDEGTDDGGEL